MRTTFLISILLLALGCNRIKPVSHANAESLKNAADSNNTFAFDLYSHLNKAENKNYFYSPYSITSAVAMAYVGADGSTHEQISRILHFGNNMPKFNDDMAGLMERIITDTTDSVTNSPISIANSVWINKNITILPSYSNVISTFYHSEANQVSFEGADAEQTCKRINDWTADRTNGKIQGLIPSLENGTNIVLVNALYFDGKWRKPFIKGLTRKDTFYMPHNKCAITDFMRTTSNFNYYEDSALQVLELPYSRNNFSMLIFLPIGDTSSARLDSSLTISYYRRITATMQPAKVSVRVPKFRFTNDYDMVDTLIRMGLTFPFNANANFSGISKSNLFFSHIYHKAFIDVSEKGTKAAAATAIPGRVTAPAPPRETVKPKIFKANHCFVYVIRENATGCILFMGRINSPLISEYRKSGNVPYVSSPEQD